jgi:hypothetical protein
MAINVLMICGSLRKGSFNRALMNALPPLAPEGMVLTESPPFRGFPHYDADLHAPPSQFAHPGPPVPTLDSLPPDVMQLLRFVNGLGETEPPTVVASLFRHLTLWPGSLAIAGALLAPLSRSGELARLRAETTFSAEQIADEMISMAKPDCPPPPEAAQDSILKALDLFRTSVIAKMLPIGRILSQALKLRPD